MATGVAGGTGGTFPTTVAHGAVQTDQRFADYNVTLNSLWNLQEVSVYYIWLSAMEFREVTGTTDWTVGNYPSLTAGAASRTIVADIPLFGTSATVGQQITEVVFYVDPAAMSTMAFNLGQVTSWATAPTGNTTTVATAANSGVAYQTVTLSSLTAVAQDAKSLFLSVVSGAVGDIFYGAEVKFVNTLYAT